MARTSSFSYTNTTASTTVEVAPIKLGLTQHYSLTQDAADVVTMNNKTAAIDSEEVISFRSRPVADVKSPVNIQYPSPIKGGIEYSVRLDDTLSTTDSADPGYRVDEPITCTITVRHPKSGNITNTIVAQVVTRALSSLIREDGTWRFDDLMRSAERPVVD